MKRIALALCLAALVGWAAPAWATKRHTVLRFAPNKEIGDRQSGSPFAIPAIPFLTGGSSSSYGLVELRHSLKKAAQDKNVDGIYLEVNKLSAGQATAEELRNALVEFKKSGKFIYAYAETYTEPAYFLASVADSIFLNPAGDLEFNGLSTTLLFFKGTLDKLEVKPEIFRVGEFKSAVEPFILDKMSDANRRQNEQMLRSLHQNYLQKISAARKIDTTTLRRLADSLSIQSPEDAIKHKLVDKLAYFDQVLESVRVRTGAKDNKDWQFMALDNYMKSAKLPKASGSKRIAVITAVGEIRQGKGSNTVIGSDKVAAEIRKARLDKNVKAIVLRINSPGGSALASDVMWREIQLAKHVKPVVASMSDVAASGGYYMSMGCHKIVAQPNTITGSIGVFGMMYNIEQAAKNKVGITFDVARTGPYADLGSMTRTMTDPERRIIQRSVERVYADFTSKAATGRNKPVDDILKVAGGRVWTGADARKLGLVDTLGGLETAIAVAADLAKIDGTYEVDYNFKKQSILDMLLQRNKDEVRAWYLRQTLGDLYPMVETAERLRSMEGIQMRMPYEYEIR